MQKRNKLILSARENGKVTKKVCDTPEFEYTCNVLCVGAGSAGVYAADSAAREGASVILCEIGENIGGMHVCGNVTGYYYGAKGGSYVEDDKKSDNDFVFLNNKSQWEQRQIRLTERLTKSGVKILCRHSPVGLYFDENRLVGILAFDGKREISIKADITIDATSDGFLIRMTDVKKHYGNPNSGNFVPFGVFLKYTKDGILKAKNNDSGLVNHYCASEFSEKIITAHANFDYALTEGEFVNLALQTGIREGLTFDGEEEVKYDDILLNKHSEKTLFYAYSDLDRHGSERATDEETFQNWWVISNLSTVTVNIPIPMGSVVPKGIKGLVTAGRCISCDTYLQSAVRMNRDMFRMGECVGVAAAMASLNNKDFLNINYNEFLCRVKKRGCFFGHRTKKFSFDNSYSRYLEKMNSLGRAPDEKYKNFAPNDSVYEPIEFDVNKNFYLLKTDAPGIAIWSCYLSEQKEETKELLYREMTSSHNKLYKYNLAIALGLLGDKRSLPTIREIIENRDCFFFTDNRRSNQFRSAVAICLLGRLGDETDLALLFDILSKEEIQKEMYHTLKANYLYHELPDRNFVYFAILTHTCIAIYKIYKRKNMCMNKLHNYFAELFHDGSVILNVTNAKEGEYAYEDIKAFISHMLKITQD